MLLRFSDSRSGCSDPHCGFGNFAFPLLDISSSYLYFVLSFSLQLSDAHALGLRAFSHALLGEQVEISLVVSAHALIVEQVIILCA